MPGIVLATAATCPPSRSTVASLRAMTSDPISLSASRRRPGKRRESAHCEPGQRRYDDERACRREQRGARHTRRQEGLEVRSRGPRLSPFIDERLELRDRILVVE